MTSRVRPACVAVFLLLTGARSGFAQQADSVAATASAALPPIVRSGALPGRGSIGGQVGGAWIVAEQDYSKGAQPRLSASGEFRYVISPHWRWQVSPLFLWNAYKVGTPAPFPNPQFGNRTIKDFYLTQVAGATGEIQWVHGGKGLPWHLGVGPGVYRVVVQDDRKVVKDPLTKRLHQGAYLGATAEWGIERFGKSLPNTSIEWTLAYHTVFAKRDEQFPSGFNGMVSAFETRLGAHYYYDFKKPKKSGADPAAH